LVRLATPTSNTVSLFSPIDQAARCVWPSTDLDQGEDAQRLPRLFLGGPGRPSRVGELRGLLGVLLGGADLLAVHVDVIARVDDRTAVVVVDRHGRVGER
jgi:hypothetical protein